MTCLAPMGSMGMIGISPFYLHLLPQLKYIVLGRVCVCRSPVAFFVPELIKGIVFQSVAGATGNSNHQRSRMADDPQRDLRNQGRKKRWTNGQPARRKEEHSMRMRSPRTTKDSVVVMQSAAEFRCIQCHVNHKTCTEPIKSSRTPF